VANHFKRNQTNNLRMGRKG